MGRDQKEIPITALAKKIVFTNKAQHDLDKAYQWYEKQKHELGKKFTHCIDTKLSSISQSPLHYQIVFNKHIRRALTNRFPYSIYFIDEENQVSVIAILHQRQRVDKSSLPIYMSTN